MISGLTEARCPNEDFCRRPRAGMGSAAGFSMIELLAVGAILLLIFVLMWAPRTSTNRQRELQKSCQTQLEKIYVALSIYANDHAGKFPQSTGALTSQQALDALVPRYTVDTPMFICPASKDPPLTGGESIRDHKISYSYYMGRRAADGGEPLMSDAQLDARAKGAGEFAFSKDGKPPANNHGDRGGNFLFGDGSTRRSPPCLSFSLNLTQGVVLLNPDPK